MSLVQGVFTTYDFQEMVFCMSQKNYDTPGYAEILEGFKQACPNTSIVVTDMPTKFALPMKSPSSHISIYVDLRDVRPARRQDSGRRQIKALACKDPEVAITEAKVPSCSYSGLHVNEETASLLRSSSTSSSLWDHRPNSIILRSSWIIMPNCLSSSRALLQWSRSSTVDHCSLVCGFC